MEVKGQERAANHALPSKSKDAKVDGGVDGRLACLSTMSDTREAGQ